MSETKVHQEFKEFVDAIDAKRTQIANMKSEDVAKDLFQILFVDDDKQMHLFRCFQVRATDTTGSLGVAQIHEPLGDTFDPKNEVLHSDKLLNETGAQFIKTIQNTAQECKVDLANAYIDLDSKYTDKKNSAVIDIIVVISALLKKGYNIYDLLWT